MEGFERALRLHAHQPGTLVSLADYLYGHTGGYIVSLSHLTREAAIYAILTGAERIDKRVLESVELDHAAVKEAAEAQRKTRQKSLDTRLFPLKMACLRHGYWLYRDGSGRRLPSAVFPEIAAAQKRLTRLAARRGTDAAVRAYELARRYFQDEWCAGVQSYWYTRLAERW